VVLCCVFRCAASAEESSITELDASVSIALIDITGVVAQIIPWNFPLWLFWKLTLPLLLETEFLNQQRVHLYQF
jgi:acyl-CoA reductase-like NAD-dependent aldehyde dehydrogenase